MMPSQIATRHIDELLHAMSLHAGQATRHQADDRPANGVSPSIARAANGCTLAQAKLLREIEAPCYRYCLAMLADPDVARDATQETGLRFLQSLNRYRGDAALTTWALSIALNVCRETRRRQRHWLPIPTGWVKHDPSPSPQELACQNETSFRVMKSLELLPQRQREAVTLRYLQGLDTKQTAKAMRCAEGTVKATLAKALARLRRLEGTDDA